MKSLEELKNLDLTDFLEMDDNYIRLQGDLTPTQYGAVKIVSNTFSAILEQPEPWPCDLCRSLDGMTLPEGHPDYERFQTPLHNKCKCFWIGSTTESKFKPPINWEPPDPNLVKEFGTLIAPTEVTVAKPYSFRKAKTIEEAEEWATETFDLEGGSNYKLLSTESANAINGRLNELLESYPEAKDYLLYTGTQYGSFPMELELKFANDKVWAQAFILKDPDTGRKGIALVFNETTWGTIENIDELTKWAVEDNWISVAGFNGRIDHEFGHIIYDVLEDTNPEQIAKLGKAFSSNKTLGTITENLGRSALANEREFWAELYAKYKSGQTIPNEFMPIVEGMLGKL